ncbi:MAG: acyl-CoA dehydrogenase [Crocinitomicaceae bacterium]|jgi:acyl-CoA dehydrogenase|nr:MAG: acyl-CoA dehydrogenase [Crocinitomicaceae bacterium]
MPLLSPEFSPIANLFQSDLLLRHFLRREASPDAYVYMYDHLDQLGALAAKQMTELSMTADRHSPTLQKRNHYGDTINRIVFHPAYDELMRIAVASGMMRVKWEPSLRQRFGDERHLLSFAAGFLYAAAESGIYCPLCMTDGIAQLIDRHAWQSDRDRLLPHIYTNDPTQFYTGAMFLTEKSGGSDVGANEVQATHLYDDYYALNGEKWFCSNADAPLIVALARTRPDVSGTAGLSIFLIERTRPDGSPNPIEVIRLKDKLGVRSMASAECVFTNTWGKILGKEGEGFKIMAEMINLSRVYNSVAAIAAARRALAEAYHYLQFRTTFGTNALNHALVRRRLSDLCATYTADFYLTFHAIRTLDAAEQGNIKAKQLLRLLTPMLKRQTAQNAVYLVRESMELMGGMGYIEDGILPKLMRDVMVLPIWEGTSNIMVLDMLRASLKSDGLQIMGEYISDTLARNGLQYLNDEHLQPLVRLWRQLSSGTYSSDITENTAQDLFEQLTALYQIAVVCHYTDEQSRPHLQPVLQHLLKRLSNKRDIALQKAPDRNTVEAMMGWA